MQLWADKREAAGRSSQIMQLQLVQRNPSVADVLDGDGAAWLCPSAGRHGPVSRRADGSPPLAAGAGVAQAVSR